MQSILIRLRIAFKYDISYTLNELCIHWVIRFLVSFSVYIFVSVQIYFYWSMFGRQDLQMSSGLLIACTSVRSSDGQSGPNPCPSGERSGLRQNNGGTEGSFS